MCIQPIKGFRQKDGKIKLSRGEMTPAVEGINGMGLPCGRCLDCRIRRQKEWAIRCAHEAQYWKHPDGTANTCFITLTYDEDHLPSDWSVDKRAWQLTAKKIRKKLGKFRYLAVGEYGGEKLRPHYHALLFGQDFSRDRVLFHDETGKPFFISPTLANIWPIGRHTIQPMTPGTINYACRYAIDKMTNTDNYERVNPFTGEVWTVNEQFVLMSTGRADNKGIGYRFYQDFKADIYPRDKVIHAGREELTPRYYNKILKRENESLALTIQEARDKSAAATVKERTPERRQVRGKIQAAKMALRKQSKLD